MPMLFFLHHWSIHNENFKFLFYINRIPPNINIFDWYCNSQVGSIRLYILSMLVDTIEFMKICSRVI